MNTIKETKLMNSKKYFLLIALLAVTVYASAQGQAERNQLPIFNSAGGPVVLFGGSSISGAAKDSKGIQYALSRAEVNSNSVKQVPLPGMVKNMAAFKKMVGAGFVAQLAVQLKVRTDEAVWSYLQQHPDLSDYGLTSFAIPFRTALGAAFIDEEVKGQKGRTYVYSMSITAPGKTAVVASSTITIGGSPDFTAPRLVQVKARDSSVSLAWKVVAHRDIPYLAHVYRQAGGRGDFIKLPAKILAKRQGDSVSFLFNERVNGNSAYRYFILPADLLDNTGAVNSDTASFVAANFRKLPIPGQVKARDTLNGILVSWKPMAINPLITGIEIERSRDSRGDFVILDTVSALAHSYMDKRLVPHIAYYYRLCVLHAGKQEQNEKFYASVSANQQKTSRVPDPPYGVAVQTQATGVRISWQPINDPDLFGYYVYRGSSLTSKMAVISPLMTDTSFTDTASNLSRQTSYVYAVKSVTTGSKESPYSGKVSAHLPGGKERPLTPGGIRLSPRAGGLYIEWDDTKKNDASVLGYILYKHPAGAAPLQYDPAKPASVEATRLNLSLVINGLVTVAFFEDTAAAGGGKNDYLVSAVDRFGVESGLSPVASTTRFAVMAGKPPVQVFARAVQAGVSLQWEQADAAGVEGFAIYRRTIGEKAAHKIAQVKNGANQYTDKAAAHGNLYVYSIKTITAAGETAPSDEHTVRK
jgi:hypothetical protein